MLFLLLSTKGLNAQSINYNFILAEADEELKEVLDVFESYIGSEPKKEGWNNYWSKEEQKRYKDYDLLESEFTPTLYMGFPIHVQKIKKKGAEYYLEVEFSSTHPDGSPNILAKVNYRIIKEEGEFKMSNVILENRKRWEMTREGFVDFYYPSYHQFDCEKAEKLNHFIEELCLNFRVEPKQIEYYFADNYNEVQQLRGFDYYMGQSDNNVPRGKATSDVVFCSGLGEYYPHEVFHVLVDPHYPEKHMWVSEGVATFLGGSRGKGLSYHLQKLHVYLEDHPEQDLTNILEMKNLDSETSYHYVIGGLFAKRIYEKGGWKMLIEFMNSGTRDEDYYEALERLLGVEQRDLGSYIRAEIVKETRD